MKLRIGTALLLSTTLPLFAGDTPPVHLVDIEPSAKSAKGVMIPPQAPNHRWILGGGLMWRNIGEIDFDTGVTSLMVPSFFGSSSFTPPPGIGAATGFANRTYDDGFVFQGSRTPATGRTANYGYNNQSQIQGSNLVYTATGGERRDVTATSSSSPTGWNEDADWNVAPYLKLSRLTQLQAKGWSFGPALHASFTNIDGSRGGLNTRMARQQLDVYDVTATDTYDASGLVLPNAPFTGASGGVNPLLPATPATRDFSETLASTDVAVFSDSISESVDVDLFSFSLGAEAVYQHDNRFFAALGAGLVMNIADWDAKRSDRLVQVTNGGAPVQIASNSASNSGTDLLWGFYLQAAAGYQLTEAFSLEANVRYDWNESLSDKVGNSKFDVDLSGFSLGLGANYTFW